MITHEHVWVLSHTHIATLQAYKVCCEAFVMDAALITLLVVSLQFAFPVQTWSHCNLGNWRHWRISAMGHKREAAGGRYYSGILEWIQFPIVLAQQHGSIAHYQFFNAKLVKIEAMSSTNLQAVELSLYLLSLWIVCSGLVWFQFHLIRVHPLTFS